MISGSSDSELPKVEVFSTGMFARPSTLLLVSKSLFDQAYISQIVATESHSVEIADSAEDAIARVNESKPDLLLIDSSLPGNVAFELCRHFKNTSVTQDIPIILLLENTAVDSQVQALDCGANDVLRKPLEKLLFLARIRSLLKYKRAVIALRSAHNELERRVQDRTAALQKEMGDHKKTEAALAESQKRFALAAEGSNDGLWDWDLNSNTIYFSTRWKSMLGFGDDVVMDSPEHWFSMINAQDLEYFQAELYAHLKNRTQHFYVECRIQHKNGTVRWVLTRGLAVRDGDGKATRIAGSQTDITSRKLMELQLRHDAFHDGLTGLPNRALFLDRLNQSIARMKRNETYEYAVLLLDIDKFKNVNDSLGHAVGDHLLIEFVRRVRRCPRATDTIGRLGGDEFVILLDDIDGMEGANTVANRIHEEFKTPLTVHGRQMFVTTSIGIALGKRRYDRADDVLRDSDTALYQAKAAGRGRNEAFTSGMHMKVLTLMDLENDLRNAVQDCSQFVLNYQPILSLETGVIVGFEALIRWNHPTRGMVSPMQFIPLAEETELIGPITYWVLKTACLQFKSWEAKAGRPLPLYISINLSGKAFSDEDLYPRVLKILQDADVDPEHIKLEITEGALMNNPELALETLCKFKAKNIGLMVDDFGTGYSSLSYLHRLPLDVLKIDRSFIEEIQTGPRNMQIVRTIALLAERLDLKIVAEGIETEDQQRVLKALRCQLGQGYLFSKPVKADEAYAFLARNLPL